MTSNLYIIVPVLNEAGNLAHLFKSYEIIQTRFQQKYNLQFIVVDDGSTDETEDIIEELAQNLDFTYLKHEVNLGPGKAFGTAFAYLADKIKDDDWVATMEGDNTSRIELLEQMFIRKNEGYEVILASPYMYGGAIINTSPIRTFLSNMANIFVKEFLDIHGILTVSSFYRLYKGRVIKDLQNKYSPEILELEGFECMVELLIKMIYLEKSISEIPLVLDTSLRVGKSKMKIMRTIWGYFKVWTHKKKWRNL
ncbi:MAG TPA: glycosyltransferase family 2 protein [Anaerolineales bacterium]|nr:glycosyltransferase family 2 protein [Anaerolineales bacterium]